MNIQFAHKIETAYHQQCKALCKEFSIKQVGFDILMFLANNPEYNHAKDIVEIRKIKANLVSIHVDELVKKGYIKRIQEDDDRRKVTLVLLDSSKEVIEKGRVFQQSFVSSLFKGIDDEQKQAFSETMKKMEHNLDHLLEE